jgi:hypothetical protein
MKFRDFLYAATPAGGSGQGEKVYLGMTKISFQIFLLPLLSLMFITRERRGSRIPLPSQAVRQLLSVIIENLRFQFRGLKCFLFSSFYPKIELSDNLFRLGWPPAI